MEKTETKAEFFGQEKVWKILLKIAPPVMLAQLIQALYNIVDSLFVGRYAETGLTALSIVYPPSAADAGSGGGYRRRDQHRDGGSLWHREER